jgi:hypothetical protein
MSPELADSTADSTSKSAIGGQVRHDDRLEYMNIVLASALSRVYILGKTFGVGKGHLFATAARTTVSVACACGGDGREFGGLETDGGWSEPQE